MSALAPKLPEPYYFAESISDHEFEAWMADETIVEHVRIASGGGKHSFTSMLFLMSKGLVRSRVLDENDEREREKARKKAAKKGHNPKLKLTEDVVGQIAQGNSPDKTKGVAILTPYSQIKTEKIRWFYPGRIPLGALTLVTGDPGGGKSTWLSDVATRTSRGWPWAEGGIADLGSVLIIQQEASKGQEIKPRLEAMGADMDRIIDLTRFVRDNKSRVNLKIDEDLDIIESCCEQLPDLKLVIIDPIADVFSGRGIYNDSDVRDSLLPLTNLAERKGFAIAAVIQFNKDSDRPLKYRMANSAAFVQVARMCWYVSDDPRSPDSKVLSLAKFNPTDAIRSGLSWRLRDNRLVYDRKAVPFSGEQIDAALQKQRLRASDAVLATGEEKEWKRIVFRLRPQPVVSVPLAVPNEFGDTVDHAAIQAWEDDGGAVAFAPSSPPVG